MHPSKWQPWLSFISENNIDLTNTEIDTAMEKISDAMNSIDGISKKISSELFNQLSLALKSDFEQLEAVKHLKKYQETVTNHEQNIMDQFLV